MTSVFAKVEAHLGAPPTVVVYTAYVRTIHDGRDPLATMTAKDMQTDMNVNVVSPAIAAKEAVAGWRKLPSSPLKTFIYTGNKLVVMARPFAPVFGMSKGAIAHLLWDLNIAYREEEYKFYFADQRFADGAATELDQDPEEGAKVYARLVEDKKQGPWYYTYVKGTGYVDFNEVYGK